MVFVRRIFLILASTASNIGLTPNNQAIVWTNDGLVVWRIQVTRPRWVNAARFTRIILLNRKYPHILTSVMQVSIPLHVHVILPWKSMNVCCNIWNWSSFCLPNPMHFYETVISPQFHGWFHACKTILGNQFSVLEFRDGVEGFNRLVIEIVHEV